MPSLEKVDQSNLYKMNQNVKIRKENLDASGAERTVIFGSRLDEFKVSEW